MILWTGWLSCWVGVVVDHDPKRDVLSVIFGGLPILLFTMSDGRRAQRTCPRLRLAKHQGRQNGVFSP